MQTPTGVRDPSHSFQVASIMSTKVLRNGTIVSWDDKTSDIIVRRNASMLLVGGRIAAIEDSFEQLSVPSGAEIIDVTDHILTPGFVNTHCHMWQTVYRSMGPDTFLAQYFGWVSQMSEATTTFKPDDIYISCLEGYCEGLNAGVTSYVEHAHNNWRREVVEPGYDAAVNSGARVWWCYDVHPREDFSSDEQAKILRSIASRNNNSEAPVCLGLATDMIGLAANAEVENTKTLVNEVKAEVLTTHYLGGPWGVGNNSPEILLEKGLADLNLPLIFSHGGFATQEDMRVLRQQDWNLSITPESEMHFGHGQATSHDIHDKASIGIDTNWTFSGDILLQARLRLQALRGRNYQHTLDKGFLPRNNPMSVKDAFLLATRQGGRALHRDDIGVLKVGAKADIVCFRTDSPNLVGWTDAVAAVVLHANIGDIRHVLVNGDFRKRAGDLVMKEDALAWTDVSARFAEAAGRIQKQKELPPPLPEKFWGGGEFGDVEPISIARTA